MNCLVAIIILTKLCYHNYHNCNIYPCRSLESLEDVIKQHKAELFTDDECRITIRCDKVFDDALVPICNNDLDKKQIRVTFLGEPAIDYGGVRREVFSLLMKSIQKNSSLLDGSQNRRVLRHNATAIQVCRYSYKWLHVLLGKCSMSTM